VPAAGGPSVMAVSNDRKVLSLMRSEASLIARFISL
jgi:hypothetical protein